MPEIPLAWCVLRLNRGWFREVVGGKEEKLDSLIVDSPRFPASNRVLEIVK